jgi:predicted transposase/invertase (TIGR01784 family)
MCVATKEKYIDPFTDFGFKHLFGNEEHKSILIGFLNDLLDIEYKIKDITFRNLERLGLNIVDRKAIFDIFCTDENNNNFIVELQRSRQKYFKDRSIYYTSFPIQEQSKKGDWDYYLNKIYFVGILDFNIDDKDDGNYLKKVELKDENNELFYDKLSYYYLQLPKFKKQESELSNKLDNWLYIFNNLNKLDNIPKKFESSKVLNELFDVAKFVALSKDKQFAYQQDLKARLDYKNVINYAVETAIEEGMQKGIEKGIEKRNIEIAKNLLDILDNDTIALKTGLSSSFIERLR